MLGKGEIKKQERKNEKDMIGLINKLNVVDQEAKVQKKKDKQNCELCIPLKFTLTQNSYISWAYQLKKVCYIANETQEKS